MERKTERMHSLAKIKPASQVNLLIYFGSYLWNMILQSMQEVHWTIVMWNHANKNIFNYFRTELKIIGWHSFCWSVLFSTMSHKRPHAAVPDRNAILCGKLPLEMLPALIHLMCKLMPVFNRIKVSLIALRIKFPRVNWVSLFRQKHGSLFTNWKPGYAINFNLEDDFHSLTSMSIN